MKKKFIFLGIMLLLVIPLSAQTWKTPEISKFITKYSNNLGTKTAYLSGKSEKYKLTCLDEKTGAQLWEMPLFYDAKGLENNFTFIDDNTFYVCDSNYHKFVDANTGKTISQIKSIFEEWDHVNLIGYGDTDFPTAPIKDSTFIIYFGKEGIQIIDLIARNEAFKTPGFTGGLYVIRQAQNLILRSSDQFVYVFNTATRKIIYKEGVKVLQLNSRFKINTISLGTTGLFICDDDVKMVNLETKKITKIPKNPLDYEFSTPLFSDSTLLYCISDEGAQIIYDVNTQTKLAEIKKGELPGLIENAKLTPDKRFVTVFVYDNDERQSTVAQIETLTGIVKWKKILFKYPSNYDVDNVNPSESSKFFGSLAKSIVSTALSRIANPRGGLRVYIKLGDNPQLRTISVNRDIELNKMFKGIQKCPGYVRLIDCNNNNLTLACVGEITPLVKDSQNDKDGEFIVTLDQNNGAIINYQPITVIPEPEDNNAIREEPFKVIKNGTSIFGLNDVYFYNDLNVKVFNFEKNKVQFIGIKNDFMFVSTSEGKDENFDFWRFNLSKPDYDKKLIAHTYEKSYIDYAKFTEFNNTINITDDDIMLLPMRNESIKEKEKLQPIWSKPHKEFDFNYFLEFKQDSSCFVQGLSFYNNNIIVASKNSIAGSKLDGSCVWKEELYLDPELIQIPISFIGNSIVFASKNSGLIVNLDCNKTKVFSDSFDNYPLSFEISKSKKGVFRFDDDILHYYRLCD